MTSGGAWLVCTRWLGLPRAGLLTAGARMLEAIGLLHGIPRVSTCGLGGIAILAWRGLSGRFVSLYILNDATIGVFSLVQAVIVHWWWQGGRRRTE